MTTQWERGEWGWGGGGAYGGKGVEVVATTESGVKKRHKLAKQSIWSSLTEQYTPHLSSETATVGRPSLLGLVGYASR